MERNALRAQWVDRAEDWRWSSLWLLEHPEAAGELLDAGPVARGAGWTPWVNAPISEAELDRLRASVNRNAPFGSQAWVEATAERLGLQASLRPRGRPRKKAFK